MKKTVSLLLIVCLLLGCLAAPAAAEPEKSVISLRLRSDVAGCTSRDADELAEILSPQVVWYRGSSPVSIANYAGGAEHAHMEAGRSYSVTYLLEAAEGYTLPETLSDGDLSLECGKGVAVVERAVTEMYNGNTDGGEAPRTRVLRIIAKVVVDGSPMQRIIGWFRDLILKIRSLQLR